jgi:hypothetical protein
MIEMHFLFFVAFGAGCFVAGLGLGLLLGRRERGELSECEKEELRELRAKLKKATDSLRQEIDNAPH